MSLTLRWHRRLGDASHSSCEGSPSRAWRIRRAPQASPSKQTLRHAQLVFGLPGDQYDLPPGGSGPARLARVHTQGMPVVGRQRGGERCTAEIPAGVVGASAVGVGCIGTGSSDPARGAVGNWRWPEHIVQTRLKLVRCRTKSARIRPIMGRARQVRGDLDRESLEVVRIDRGIVAFSMLQPLCLHWIL